MVGTRGNRRQHFRVNFQYPLCTKMMIKVVANKSIPTTKYTRVCIHDFSAGGLGFVSHLDLPAKQNILYQFETRILDQELKLKGTILRKVTKNHFFNYGVRFVMDQEEQESLLALLNLLSIQLKESSYLKSCDFCTKNQNSCLLRLKRNG